MSISLEAKTNQNDDIRQFTTPPPNVWKDSHPFTSHFHPDMIMVILILIFKMRKD